MAKRPQKRPIRARVARKLELDPDGPASAEQILERLDAARDQASRQCLWFLIASVAFLLLFGLKIAGLRGDVTLFDQKIFEVPYGIFIFCILAQLASCMYFLRSLDATVYDRFILAVCEKAWPEKSAAIYRTYPNSHSWLEPSADLMEAFGDVSVRGCLHALTLMPIMLLVLTALASPTAAGVYYLWNWKELITSGWINLQYYSVLISTIAAFLVLINGASLTYADSAEDE